MRPPLFFIAAFLLFLMTATAWADEYPPYASRKLGRGISNVALGWTEVLSRQSKCIEEAGVIPGTIWGTIDGVGNAVKRTAIGIFETATFPIKTSDNADAYMEPEFPLSQDRAGYRPKDYSF